MEYSLLTQLLADRAAKRPVVVATNLDTGISKLLYPYENNGVSPDLENLMQAAREAAGGDRGSTVESPEGPVFLNVFNPPLRLIVVGAVHIAQPLAVMAAEAGYQVTIIDPRRAFATAERFPGVSILSEWPDEALEGIEPDPRTAVVTLTHDPKLDDPALTIALKSEAFFIGALGSKKTHAARLERLRRAGFGEDDLARVHGPVGLAIGARSPAEIAVSILAQVTQALRQREGGH